MPENRSETLIRVGILSDSHGLLRPEVVCQLSDCSHILHAGDIVRESDLDELSFYGNVYAVRGNCDTAPWAYRLQGLLRFEIGGVRFLMVHDRRNLPRDPGDARVIICGHTHHYEEESMDGRLYLNPGSCGYPRYGTEVTMAKMLIQAGRFSVHRIDLAGGSIGVPSVGK